MVGGKPGGTGQGMPGVGGEPGGRGKPGGKGQGIPGVGG